LSSLTPSSDEQVSSEIEKKKNGGERMKSKDGVRRGKNQIQIDKTCVVIARIRKWGGTVSVYGGGEGTASRKAQGGRDNC